MTAADAKAADTPSVFDVTAFLEGAASRRFARFMLVMCGVLVAIEGVDMYAIASILPALAHAYGVAPAAFAIVFVAQGFGLVIGSYLLAPRADHVGRRPIILGSMLLFGGLMLVTAAIESLVALAILRFVAFIAVGAATPNLFAIASEFAAPALRPRYVLAMGAIHGTGGGIAAGIAAATLGISWRAPLLICGALTLLAVALAWRFLPESLSFLISRAERDPAPARRAILHIDPTLTLDGGVRFHIDEPREERVSVRALFSAERAGLTVLLWIAVACLLPLLGAMGQWLPTFMARYAGITLPQAAAISSIGAVTAALWPFVLMVMMARLGVARGLALNLALGAAVMLAFSTVASVPAARWIVAIGFGAFVAGSMSGLYTLLACSYPTELRATGMGWALGSGRIVSIVMLPLGGAALALDASPLTVAVAVATPLLGGAIAAFLIALRTGGASRRAA